MEDGAFTIGHYAAKDMTDVLSWTGSISRLSVAAGWLKRDFPVISST